MNVASAILYALSAILFVLNLYRYLYSVKGQINVTRGTSDRYRFDLTNVDLESICRSKHIYFKVNVVNDPNLGRENNEDFNGD